MSIDSSGLIMTRPDSFVPLVDIIANDKYRIYMDVPGININKILKYIIRPLYRRYINI